MRYRTRPFTVEIEAITFDELVAHGLANGANVVNGMPWSFDYQGQPITHENDDCYLIPMLAGTVRFNRGDFLASDDDGNLFVCTAGFFNATYEPVLDGAAPLDTPTLGDDCPACGRSFKEGAGACLYHKAFLEGVAAMFIRAHSDRIEPQVDGLREALDQIQRCAHDNMFKGDSNAPDYETAFRLCEKLFGALIFIEGRARTALRRRAEPGGGDA